MNGSRRISLVATLKRKISRQAERKRKQGTEVSDQLVADQIVEELIDLALNCPVPKVKLAAIVTILNYVDGRPVAPVSVSVESESGLAERCRQAMEAVLKFAAANDLQMTPTEAVAWVAAREPRAREILSDFITIDVTPEPAAGPEPAAAATDTDAAGVQPLHQ